MRPRNTSTMKIIAWTTMAPFLSRYISLSADSRLTDPLILGYQDKRTVEIREAKKHKHHDDDSMDHDGSIFREKA